MTRHITLCLALMLAPAVASAHGAEPLPTDMSAVGDADWVLRTNFGLITSDAPDRYVCEEAFAGGEDFQVGVLGLNEWLVFTNDAVLYSPDSCNFEIRQQIPRKPAGVAVSPDSTRAAYLINVDEATDSGVWWTEDQAATVEQAALDTALLHLSRAAFLDESRLLVSAYSSEDATRGEARLIVVNLDDGTSEQVGDLAGLSYPYLFDVEAGWVVWLARDDAGQVIFWGPTDEPTRYSRAVDSWPSGAVLDADGQSVWVSGVNAETLADHSALCVGRVGESHYLCARRDREEHDLSRVGSHGSIKPVVDFSTLAGPRNDCPADSDVATTCSAVWPELAGALGIEVDSGDDTGGQADAGSGADSGGGDGGGCSTGGSGVPIGAGLALGGVWIIGRRRK